MKLGKTIKYLTLSLALAGGVSQADAAVMQEIDEAKIKAMFDAADTDKDTFVSKSEGNAFAFKMLKTKMGDKMDDEQLKKMATQVVDQFFKLVDTDKDGKISFKELKNAKPPKQP